MKFRHFFTISACGYCKIFWNYRFNSYFRLAENTSLRTPQKLQVQEHCAILRLNNQNTTINKLNYE